jgi:hypothetical protein
MTASISTQNPFKSYREREKATPEHKSKISLPVSLALGQSSYVRATSST